MAVPKLDSPLQRDILLGLLAAGLLTAPLWIGLVGISGPTYTYDRAEVTVNETGIEYVNSEEVPFYTPISDSVECAGWVGDLRACSFERYLLQEDSLPTEIYQSNPNMTLSFSAYEANYYRYVQIDNKVYEPSLEVNTSAEREGSLYRVDMVLDSADPAEVLQRVSLDVDEVDSVTAETAQEGVTTSTNDVAVPETPVKIDDGTYYRVYQERGFEEPSTAASGIHTLFTYGGPVIGLVIVASLSRRVEINYNGNSDRR